jgi:hypothetical protein
MTAETLVHRWDAEVGAGLAPEPFDAAVAADGVKEYVTLLMPLLREMRRSPAGPSVQIECSDVDDSWYLQLDSDGGCTVSATPMEVAATLRGPAGGLLLALMGRQSLEEAGVEFDGDPRVLEDRDELFPRA